MSAPSVGVVIPARNAAATLARALDAIAAQSVAASQVVVVDDGSDDTTVDIARRADVGVVLQDHAGPGVARNRGVAVLDTEWVAFLDADDVWPTDHLERVASYLTDDVDLVACGCVRVDEAGVRIGGWAVSNADLTVEGLVRGNKVTTSGVLARRDMVEDVCGFDEGLAFNQDFDLWVRMLLAGARAIPASVDVTYHVREHPEDAEKLARIEASKRLLHAKLYGLLPDELAAEAERRGNLDLAMRYLKSGRRRDALRCARAAGPSTRALGVAVLAVTPQRAVRALRRAVRRSRGDGAQ